ncbi:MAG TPA: nitrophenyl compound nitroreductase subunit ArsF family protein [Bacteroidales bacterium]|mgnify:CR=1 FL=1|nr:nitrophenyl compound nitroreductase subunit ArsF family protein [Bacteroidales bacterium]
MRKLNVLFSLVFLFFVACQSSSEKTKEETSSSNQQEINLNTETPVVLVYNFYAKHRCASCIAIENATKKTLDTYFANEVKQGKIKQFSINIDDEANAKICEKYQAFGSGIYLTQVLKGKETNIDLTGDGFKFALNKEEKFIEILKTNIENLLKQ